jgi:hypothetical protein
VPTGALGIQQEQLRHTIGIEGAAGRFSEAFLEIFAPSEIRVGGKGLRFRLESKSNTALWPLWSGIGLGVLALLYLTFRSGERRDGLGATKADSKSSARTSICGKKTHACESEPWF